MARPAPKLKRHTSGQACVSFRLNGRRRWVYFGPWGSRSAAVKYAKFCRNWYSILYGPWPTPGKRPAPRRIEYQGETLSAAGWSKRTGIRATTIRYRLDVLRWSVERSLTTPARRIIRQRAG